MSKTEIQGLLKYRGNADADWGGDKDNAKSTSGSCFFLGKALVSWSAKTQTTTATSSTYAEYIALYHALCEALWGRKVCAELKLPTATEPTQISSDNQPAIHIAEDNRITSRSKHFETKYHFMHENFKNGNIILPHIPGIKNVADIFTKPLTNDAAATGSFVMYFNI
jgi:hypothetical protein